MKSKLSTLPLCRAQNPSRYHVILNLFQDPIEILKRVQNDLNFFLLIIIFAIIGINVYFLFVSPDLYTKAKKMLYSLSAGDRYYGRLSLWYLYAQDGRLVDAAKLEPKLDPVDIVIFKSQNFPSEIKKRLNELSIKRTKITEDWMEIAILQTKLGKNNDALNSLVHAKQLDPVRSDIEKLYYELSK